MRFLPVDLIDVWGTDTAAAADDDSTVDGDNDETGDLPIDPSGEDRETEVRDLDESEDVGPPVELVEIYLPSNTPMAKATDPVIVDLLAIELRLRKGQANDVLHEICLSVAAKSFLFREKLRKVKAKAQKAKVWGVLTGVDASLRDLHRVYQASRRAMIIAGATPADLQRYKELVRKDLKVNAAVTNPNAPGSTKTELAWFWSSSDAPIDDQKTGTMWTECTFSSHQNALLLIIHSHSGELSSGLC